MNFRLTKIFEGVFSTEVERRRIREAFKDQPEVAKKLNELMDAIEAMDWKLAVKLLESKWWKGRDKKRECPRVEFIGCPDPRDPSDPKRLANGFDVWSSYMDLVWALVMRPESYKLERLPDDWEPEKKKGLKDGKARNRRRRD